MKRNNNSYKKSGVNISLANKLVNYISNVSKKNVRQKKPILLMMELVDLVHYST